MSKVCAIRRVEAEDVQGLIELMHQLAQDGDNLMFEPCEVPCVGRMMQIVEAKSSDQLFVALLGRTIVGYVGLRQNQFTRTKHIGILAVGTAKPHRGSGIGKQMMKHAIHHAESVGLRRLELRVSIDNVAAIKMYERFSFQREGIARNAAIVSGKTVDKLYMARLLS